MGAWCDYVTEDEYRAEPAGSTGPPEEVAQVGWARHRPDRAALETFRQALHFRVEEFATLSDGRRLTLTDDRGWSSRGARWADLTVEAVETDVRNVVLPDDAEQTGDEHPWAGLTERLGAHDVETTPDELRRLPYDVILSQRLRARLSAPE